MMYINIPCLWAEEKLESSHCFGTISGVEVGECVVRSADILQTRERVITKGSNPVFPSHVLYAHAIPPCLLAGTERNGTRVYRFCKMERVRRISRARFARFSKPSVLNDFLHGELSSSPAPSAVRLSFINRKKQLCQTKAAEQICKKFDCERARRIELPSLPWQGSIIATIRCPPMFKIQKLENRTEETKTELFDFYTSTF